MTPTDVRDGARRATATRVERLSNDLWRVEYRGHFHRLYRHDPRPAIRAGRMPREDY